MDSGRFGVLAKCLAAIIAVLMAAPVAAIVGGVGSADAADDIKSLKIGFMQKIDSLSPYLGLTDAAYVFYGLVYDSLHSVDNNLSTEGNLAVNWEVDESVEPYGSAWLFDITPNAKWHDGEDFTVDDVVYNIKLNGQNYIQMWAYQPYAYYMQDAEVVDDDTVRIYFWDRVSGEPKAAAYADLICIPMLPKHLLDEMDPADIGFTWEGYFEDEELPIVGTGPFMATETIYDDWVGGDEIILVRNPDYHWGVDKDKYVGFDQIELHFYDDATGMQLDLERGLLDVAQFPPDNYNAIKNDIDSGEITNMTAYDGLKCTQYWTEIGINMGTGGPNPSRLDPNIRHAMAMATDKTYIVQNQYKGYAEEGTTLISPVNEKWHYEPTEDELFAFDLDAAAELLENAGYRYTEDSPTVRVCTEDSWAVQEELVLPDTKLQYDMLIRSEFPEEKEIAKFLQAQWAEIGISINYRVVSEVTLSTIVYTYTYDTMIWYWSADPDPNFMLFCQSENSWNGWSDNRYSNESYEENYSKSVSEFDYETRKEYCDNVQRISYEDAAYILLAYPYQTYIWRTDTFEGWGDWEANPGRSIDAFWTGNPLWFDLEPIGEDDQEIDILMIVLGAGVAIAVVVGVVFALKFMKKRGGKKEDERESGGSPLGD